MIDTSGIHHHRSLPGLKWWVAYIHELFREVEARPRGSTVLDNKLSDIAIQRAVMCSSCSQHVHQDIKCYFSKKVEDVVSKVVLNVDFAGSQVSQIEKSPGSDG